MADELDLNKPVKTAQLKTLVDKIKGDYAKTSYIDSVVEEKVATQIGQKVNEAIQGIDYATDEEILALFEDDPVDEEADDPSESNESEPNDGQ